MDLTSSTFSVPTAATPQLTAEQLAKRGQIEKDFTGALDRALILAKSQEARYLPGWCGPSEP